ncbi:Transmembrane protein 8B [Hypsibius exemplaris]|uniref:Transmembrane protein 8B n=1 Tax=Hypsibius exemplaris TaxID=2072580 RepID=A0A1W0X6T1_HYPEX|nr:Transmembrane protein 8B [Hypsibius exemplaris]
MSTQLSVTSPLLFLLLLVVLSIDISRGSQLQEEQLPSPSISPFVEGGLNYHVKQVNGGRRLSIFTSYKDVVLTEFRMPGESVAAIFGVASTSNPAGCAADKTISVAIQHAGFPFLWANYTGTSGVFMGRDPAMMMEYPATDNLWKITVPAPRTGLWYAAVSMRANVSNHIKQKGLFSKCEVTCVLSFLTSAHMGGVVQLASGEKYEFKSSSLEPEAPSYQLFKMCLMEDRYDAVDVQVHCDVGCPLIVRARSDGLPIVGAKNGSVHTLTCQGGFCAMTYEPIQKTCQYVAVNFAGTANFSLTVTAVRCRKPVTRLPTEADMVAKKRQLSFDPDTERRRDRTGEISNTKNKIPDVALANESFYHGEASVEQPLCPYILGMARLDVGPAFTSSFGLNKYEWPSTESLFLPTAVYSDTILKFDVTPYKDTGGTLSVSLNLTGSALPDLRNFTVVACLNTGQGSRFNILSTCRGPLLVVNDTHLYEEVVLPYPEVGTYYFNLQGIPLVGGGTPTSDFPLIYVPVHVAVRLDQCMKGTCGPYGTCKVFLNSGVMITSACVCAAGWKGWDCQDGSEAESTVTLIMAVVFLTLSNLIFLPAAVVAIRREYYPEAVVYLCTCFFSSFYHACDQPLKRFSLCIMDYGVLQFCDFNVSILSFWMTIIAMADLPAHLRSVAHIAGAIGIALGVEYEKTGIWVFAVPAIVALLITGTSWGFRSYRMRKIVPQKRYWLIHFAPGFILAAVGLILFAFVETGENYKFVHSVWHMLMALAVICFLPPAHCRLDGKYPKLRAIGTESTLSTSSTILNQDLLASSRNSESPLSLVA